MRLHILAVGHARGTPEGALSEDFVGRAQAMGRRMGIAAVTVDEITVSKARETRTRMAEEAEKLSDRIPDGAHVVLLDARGKGMTSEDFAEMLGALRDAGTKDMAFVIGGPDGRKGWAWLAVIVSSSVGAGGRARAVRSAPPRSSVDRLR